MSRNSLSYKDWTNETELWQRQFSAEICGCHNDLKRIRYFLNCDKLEEIWFRKGEVPNRPGEGRPCSGSVQGHGVAKNIKEVIKTLRQFWLQHPDDWRTRKQNDAAPVLGPNGETVNSLGTAP